MEAVDLKTLIEKTAANKSWFLKESLTFSVEDIWNANNCKNIIFEYLGKAGTKPDPGSLAEVLSLTNYKYITPNRYQHILITYFFGLAIYNNCRTIKGSIDRSFCDNKDYKDALTKHRNAPFAYLWFLICLFHDLGYQFENNKSKFEENYSNVSKFKDKTQVDKQSIIDHFVGVPNFYKQIIPEYFDYRVKEMGKFDHGIVGGMLLYHDLCEIRREKVKDKRNKEKVDDGYWRQSLEQVFAYAASVVVCHNIFINTKTENIALYNKYKLSALNNIGGEHKIKFEEFPVFFLFCLVDTLEPIKIIKDPNLLDKICVDFSKNVIKLKINLTCGCKKTLIDNYCEMNDWLCLVQTVQEDNETIKINIKN